MGRVLSESVSDWESLPPEILGLILQRVLQAGCVQRGEGRRIVAVAGVCRSWRQLVLQQQQQEEAAVQKSVTFCCSSSTLIRFPAAIRKQAAVDCPLQCVLKKKGNFFFFFQSVDDGAVDQEYFLLAARKRCMPSCSSFEISTDIKSLVKERAVSGGCVASVRSNFSRSEFVLLQYNDAPPPGKSPLRVKYSEQILAGARQRKLSCGLKPVSNSGTSVRSSKRSRASMSAPLRDATSAATRRSFLAWTCFLNTRRQARRVHSTLEDEHREESRGGQYGEAISHEKQLPVKHEAEGQFGLSRAFESEAPGIRLSLKSKVPEWNQERGCWSLDFKGRATMASIHNFQLIFSSESSTNSNAAASSPDDDQRVVLQLGKVGKALYLADVYSPLSALDAFSICLTSFATNVGLEP